MPIRNARNSTDGTKKSKSKLKKKSKTKAKAIKKIESQVINKFKRYDFRVKKIHIVKCVDKPTDKEWITSGKIGSKDAVLIFRTDILNPANLKLNDKQLPSIPSNYLTATSSTNNSSANDSSLLYTFPCTSQAMKVNQKSPDKKMASLLKLTDTTKSRNEVFEKRPKYPMKVERRLLKSLSYCDNSISSDYEDFVADDDDDDDDDDGEEEEAGCYGDRRKGRHASNKSNIEDDAEIEDLPFSENMPAINLQITYKFIQTETKLLRKIFLRHGLKEAEDDENFNILWTGIHMKPDILRNLMPYQRVNHFPRSYELTRKDRLYKNIERMQHLHGMKHFDIIPQSFVLPLEYRDLLTAHNKCRGPWIVKPAASSRGRGIFIVNSPDQIPQEEQVLVSKYVADPLCIDGHKCDLRVYVLVTSFDPLLIYLYKEGLVRLATVKYERDADSLWNPCMHLCNYSINKYHSDYIKSNDAQEEDVGHKWTLSALLRHLKLQGCDTKQLMANIEDLIIKSILSCTQSIVSACRMFVPNGNNCFELYGFDILIDDTLKPWLLEINLSPSMGVDSPLDTKVKASLITDLLTCVGIPALSPSMRSHYDTKWTRFRNVSCSRRTNSADTIGYMQTSGGKKGAAIPPQLTLEEQRIIRSAKLQNSRRGGFVRIFPTDDSFSRYGNFLDPTTGIPFATTTIQGQPQLVSILQHNYNALLYNNLYGKCADSTDDIESNSQDDRMIEYERALQANSPIMFKKKLMAPRSVEEGKRLRKQMHKLMESGSELTQLQIRRTFSLYLEAVLKRLTMEPKDYHEKLILKFLNRIGGIVRAPMFFRNPQNMRMVNKARSAMVAKLLGDFLEQYNRETEAYVDSFDHYGMIPSSLYSEFLTHAQEADLESVLVMHTSMTGRMSYLYNRFGLAVPPTPPIPSGTHGFLRALPEMVVKGSASRDFNKTESYYKSGDVIAGYKCERLPQIATAGSNKRSTKHKM